MGQVCARLKAIYPVIPCRGRDYTQSPVVGVSRVEITEGEKGPQGCSGHALVILSLLSLARAPHKKARRDLVKKSREWVLEKKERRRRQGK